MINEEKYDYKQFETKLHGVKKELSGVKEDVSNLRSRFESVEKQVINGFSNLKQDIRDNRPKPISMVAVFAVSLPIALAIGALVDGWIAPIRRDTQRQQEIIDAQWVHLINIMEKNTENESHIEWLIRDKK